MNDWVVASLARVLANYHLLNHKLERADCIVVLCSNDPRVAERGAELFLQGWAPMILFSGNVGALTAGLYGKPEAEYFADIAMRMGVPAQHILIENQATNTGENIRYSRALLENHGIHIDQVILVQKPYMERRSFATFKRFWPEKRVIVTSPQIPFESYALPHLDAAQVIHIMVGDLQRIKLYPQLGFQIQQEIPDEVWSAYERLVELGYTGHLVQP
jgi:uncharacterized SAM-binding protein YcdF (DUF218 family)